MRTFHLVHTNCKGVEESLSLDITLNNNIGRHNPSFILKTPNFDIKNIKIGLQNT